MITFRRDQAPNPNACVDCGYGESDHKYANSHQFVTPSDELRLARMKERRERREAIWQSYWRQKVEDVQNRQDPTVAGQ